MTATLAGLRVWVTRPVERSDATVLALTERGAGVEAVPFVRIVALSSPPSDAALDAVELLVVTSPTAAEQLGMALRRSPRRQLLKLPCYVVGDATAAALRSVGFADLRIAPQAHADALATAILADAVGPKRMLLPGSRLRRAQLPHALRAAGHELVLWDLYDTVAVDALPGPALARLRAGERPLLLLFSPSAASAVSPLIGDDAIAHDLPCAVLGPVTEATARQAGLRVVVAPAQIGAAALLAAIEAWWASR
jgi:uroporphyrinogen-III synthase